MIEISEELVRRAVGVLNEQRHRGLDNWDYDEDAEEVYAYGDSVRTMSVHGDQVHLLTRFEAVACALLYAANLGAIGMAVGGEISSGIPDDEGER